jgi:hypothetical protein
MAGINVDFAWMMVSQTTSSIRLPGGATPTITPLAQPFHSQYAQWLEYIYIYIFHGIWRAAQMS